MKALKQHCLRWFALAALCGISVMHAQAQTAASQPAASLPGTRIAVVNSERILRESGPAKAAQGKLELEFAKRDHVYRIWPPS